MPRLLFSVLGLPAVLGNPLRTEVPCVAGMRITNLPCSEAESGLCTPPAGRPGVLLAQRQRADSRSGKTLSGKPQVMTSPSSVTSSRPRGVRGFRQRRFPRDCAGHGRELGSCRGLQRAFTAPCVCPTGPARPRVRSARTPAGAMGRSGRRCCCCCCCCPPPARARLEPCRGQPPAAGPQVTLAAPGSVARVRSHVEEPSVQ